MDKKGRIDGIGRMSVEERGRMDETRQIGQMLNGS
jgi:hypothetical protein